MTVAFTRVPAATARAQIVAIFRAWGFDEPSTQATADGLNEADLKGIDSHGIAMLPVYRRFLDEDRVNRTPALRVVRETAVALLIDADSAMGFLPSYRVMEAVIDKAMAQGIAIGGVRRSNHFGAAGIYAARAAERGLIGIACTNVFAPAVVPTRSRVAMFGTNPIAFAAPAARNKPFLFDMATSTVALGKIMTAQYRRKPIPRGWALGPDGQPTTDADLAYDSRMATPLGALPELSSHKGYGLAAMVEILCAMLPGASWVVESGKRAAGARRGDVGHIFFAIDPKLFREPGEFERDLDQMIDGLHAAPPVNPGEPVLVAGDPEYAQYADRSANGIPLPRPLLATLRDLALRANAEWLLPG